MPTRAWGLACPRAERRRRFGRCGVVCLGLLVPAVVPAMAQVSQDSVQEQLRPEPRPPEDAPRPTVQEAAESLDVIEFIDATDVTSLGTPPQQDAIEVLVIEHQEESVISDASAVWQEGRTIMSGGLASRLLLDTKFERTGEDVLEWWNLGRVRIDHRQGRALRGVVEGWVRWGVAADHPPAGERFALFNAHNAKWTGEAELREAKVTWNVGPVAIGAGQSIYVWGKNELFAPADVLNPSDLRYDPLVALTSLKDSKVPVFAMDAAYLLGDHRLALVVLPFFTPNRGLLIGRDFALAPPASAQARELSAVGVVHPSVEDALQQCCAGTRVPQESPAGASVALRAEAHLAGWDLALTTYYGWDRTPHLRIDADLRKLLGEINVRDLDAQTLIEDPELLQTGLALEQKLAMGQEVVTVAYKRRAVFALEAEGVVGDFVPRVDVGFSPKQILYTHDYKPIRRSTVRGVLGVEYTYGETWYAAVAAYGFMVLKAPEGARLLGVEAASETSPPKRMAAAYGVSATARWLWVEEELQVMATALYNISPGDLVVIPKVSYALPGPHKLTLGALVIGGPRGTLGERYRRNDMVFLEYAIAF